MKKFFTLVALATMALAANAQNAVYTELGYESIEGINKDEAIDAAAGTALGTDAAGNVFSTAFDDKVKLVGVTCSKYNKIVVNGTEYSVSGGYQGSNNPKDEDGAGVAVSCKVPTQGSVLQIDCKKDGYLYVVGKFSNNKQYMVYEDGSAIGYEIVIDGTAAGQTATAAKAEVKGDDAEFQYYVTTSPSKIGAINGLGDGSANNGVGFIKFSCSADTKYYVSASGSKLTQCGTIFSESGKESIVLKGDADAETGVAPADVVLEPYAGTGINNVAVAKVQSNVSYNAVGQRVNANSKGMVIRNGKKFMNK